jgi:predicted transcriptional regulator
LTRPKKYKRKPVEKTRDRTRIAALYLSGHTQQEIAKEIGITQQTVSRDIKVLQDEWKERSSQDIETWKAGELAYLQQKRRELEDIWKLSQNRTNTIKTKRAVMVGGVVTQQEVSEREELELADTKIGTLLLSISDKIAALTGIEAPRKNEVTGKDGAPLEVKGYTITANPAQWDADKKDDNG